MSVDTAHKFSCDYSYISIFNGCFSLKNHLVLKFKSPCARARAVHRVLRLRGRSLIPANTPKKISWDYSYISIVCGYLFTVNLLFCKFA